MRKTPKSKPNQSDDTTKLLHVLVVDDGTEINAALAELFDAQPVQIHQANTEVEARRAVTSGQMDIALISASLAGIDAMELIRDWKQTQPATQSILVSQRPNYQQVLATMRTGAVDLLSRPIQLADLSSSMDRAMSHRAIDDRTTERMNRLRELCRKLTNERQEMTEQVDSLCNDLADAYKELAGQFKHVELTARFEAVVEQELDLEQVLRRYLEVVLQECGPTNAVVFLPSHSGEFAVGGYINFDLNKPTLDEMLISLSAEIAPAIAELDQLSITANADAFADLADVECDWLQIGDILALPVRDGEELLASILIFRDAEEGFDEKAIGAVEAVSPILARHLTKVVHVHHRLRNDDAALEHGDSTDPDEMEFD